MIPPTIPDGFQEKLQAYDPRLRVTWDYEKDLWKLEERGMRTGQWRYVFYWATKEQDGSWSFLPLPSSPDLLLRQLAELDFERYGVMSERDYRKYAFNHECKRLEVLRNRQKENRDFIRQRAREKFAYYMRGRRVVAF